jgi:hypothetical protein
VIAVVLVGGALAAAFGPRFTQATSRSAGEPFSYTPPPEFNPADPEQLAAIQASAPQIRGAWVVASSAPGLAKPSVSLLHAPRMEGVEMSELDAIADGMPALLAASGATWRTERISRESRGDGTSVGWIEGACSKGELGYHSLELVFPDDDGTSFVTATLPDPIAGSTAGSSTEAKLETWDAEFLATVHAATGVALRIGAPPWWMRAGWGGGVALLLLLASNIVDRRKSRVPAGASIPAPPMPLYKRSDASEP